FRYYGPVDDGVCGCFHDHEGAFRHSVFRIERWVDFDNFPGTNPGIASQRGAERLRLVYRQPIRNWRSRSRRDTAVDTVDIERDVDEVAVRQHFQRTLGHHNRSQFLNLFGLDKVYVVLVDEVVFRFFQVADRDIHDVFGQNLWTRGSHVLDLFPILNCLTAWVVHLTFKVVDAAGHGKRHTVHVARLCGVWRMDIGMGVDPDHAQTFLGIRLSDTADGAVCRAVIARDHQWEVFIQYSLVHFKANPFFHDKHAVNEFGVSMSGAVVKQFIYVFNLYQFVLFEEVGVQVQAGNLQRFHPQAGAARTCTDLGLNGYDLYFFHKKFQGQKRK